MKIKVTKEAILSSTPKSCKLCVFSTLAKERLKVSLISVWLIGGSSPRVEIMVGEGQPETVYRVYPENKAFELAYKFDRSVDYSHNRWEDRVLKDMEPFIGEEFELKGVAQ